MHEWQQVRVPDGRIGLIHHIDGDIAYVIFKRQGKQEQYRLDELEEVEE